MSDHHHQNHHTKSHDTHRNTNSSAGGGGEPKRIEWSRSTILGFIEDYRQHRVLWDPNTKGYHIKQTKYEALKLLGHKYGAEIRSIRSKIKSLRSSFHREHGKVINGLQRGVHYQPMWFAYEAIRFILDGEQQQQQHTESDNNSKVLATATTTIAMETRAAAAAAGYLTKLKRRRKVAARRHSVGHETIIKCKREAPAETEQTSKTTTSTLKESKKSEQKLENRMETESPLALVMTNNNGSAADTDVACDELTRPSDVLPISAAAMAAAAAMSGRHCGISDLAAVCGGLLGGAAGRSAMTEALLLTLQHELKVEMGTPPPALVFSAANALTATSPTTAGSSVPIPIPMCFIHNNNNNHNNANGNILTKSTTAAVSNSATLSSVSLSNATAPTTPTATNADSNNNHHLNANNNIVARMAAVAAAALASAANNNNNTTATTTTATTNNNSDHDAATTTTTTTSLLLARNADELAAAAATATAAAIASATTAAGSGTSGIGGSGVGIGVQRNDFDSDSQTYCNIRAEDVKTELIESDSTELAMFERTPPVTSIPPYMYYKLQESPMVNRKRKAHPMLAAHCHNYSNNDEDDDAPSPSKQQQLHSTLNLNSRQNELLDCTIPLLANGASTSTSSSIAATPSAGNVKPKLTTSIDEYGIFGEYVAVTIRKLKTAKAKIVVKHLINNLLFEAELGKYDHGMPASKEPPQLYKL